MNLWANLVKNNILDIKPRLVTVDGERLKVVLHLRLIHGQRVLKSHGVVLNWLLIGIHLSIYRVLIGRQVHAVEPLVFVESHRFIVNFLIH